MTRVREAAIQRAIQLAGTRANCQDRSVAGCGRRRWRTVARHGAARRSGRRDPPACNRREIRSHCHRHPREDGRRAAPCGIDSRADDPARQQSRADCADVGGAARRLAIVSTHVPVEARTRADVRARVVSGTPATEIVRIASEIDADLIVMGVMSRGAIGRNLFGSTAARVIRTAGQAGARAAGRHPGTIRSGYDTGFRHSPGRVTETDAPRLWSVEARHAAQYPKEESP